MAGLGALKASKLYRYDVTDGYMTQDYSEGYQWRGRHACLAQRHGAVADNEGSHSIDSKHRFM